MSILKRIFGQDEEVTPNSPAAQPSSPRPAAGAATAAPDQDTQAIERYRYMLKTAPPETLEQAHTEAFAKLTPEQRQQVLQEMSQGVPPGEQPVSDDPQALARAATRAEVRQPGYMERTFGGMGMGMGGGMMGGGMSMGGLIGGSLLTSIAGSFIGSSIAHSFFAGPMGAGFGGYHDGPDVVNNYYGDQNGNDDRAESASSDNAAGNHDADSSDAAGELSTADSSDFDLADAGGLDGDFGGLDI